MNVLIQVALRNVFRNRRRTVFTLAAIVVALAVVQVITSINNSFYRFTVGNAVDSKLGALQIHRSGYLSNISLNPLSFHFPYTSQFVFQLEQIDGVKAVSGRIQFRGLVSNGREQALFFGSAVDPQREGLVCPRWMETLSFGSQAFESSSGAQAILGLELGRSLGAALDKKHGAEERGDFAYLNLSAASPNGRQNAIDVQIRGLMRSTLPIEEKRSLMLPLSVAQDLLGLPGAVTEVAVAVDDFEQIESVRRKLQSHLGEDYEVSTWADVQPFLRDVVFRQKVMIGIVSAILFILAVFVIANTMTMAVFERTREIGTMLSLGVRKNTIRIIFLLEALFVGVVGAFIGSCVGLSIVFYLSIRGIPFGTAGFGQGILYPFLTLDFVLISFCVAIVCSVLAGVAPARKASDMNPVDALRST
jgi:putative ABC transport system permease protein